MLISCGNNEAKKSIEQAIVSMENEEYDEAAILLEVALNEDGENKEAVKLYNIINDYNKANEELKDSNIVKAKEILDEIDKDYTNYSIKNDINSLKEEVDLKFQKSNEVNEYLKEAEQLFYNHKYLDAQICLNSNILGLNGDGFGLNQYASENQKEKAIALIDKCDEAISQIEMTEEYERQKAEGERQRLEVEAERERLENERQRLEEERLRLEAERERSSTRSEYIQKLDAIEIGLSDLDYLYQGSYEDLKKAAKITLTRWDDMLNEIYGLLKVQLSESEMDELTEEELDWIEYRDLTASNAIGGLQDGGAEYNLTSAALTKERCYELVNIYMK